MDQEFGIIELPPPSFPLPLSPPPPPSSSSQPTPPQFSQAGWPKENYQLPAQYEDFNPEPLQLLKEEDEQPTAALPHLHLIVHNRLQTATNSFGLLREYLDQPSWLLCSQRGPSPSWRDWSCIYLATIPIPCSSKWISRNAYELEGLWHIHEIRCWGQSSCKRCPSWPQFQAWRFARLINVVRENQQSDTAKKKSPFFNSFQMADIDIEVPSGTSGIPPGTFSVPGLVYRKLTAIIQASFLLPLASHWDSAIWWKQGRLGIMSSKLAVEQNKQRWLVIIYGYLHMERIYLI